MPVVSRVIFSFIGANEAVPRDLHQPNVCVLACSLFVDGDSGQKPSARAGLAGPRVR